MTLFDLNALIFQAGILLTAGELLGQWLLVPAVFKFGLGVELLEEPSDCPLGLTTPRRDRSLSLVFRVLSGNVCIFRPQWGGWFQSPFQIHGMASWSAGQLRIQGRHTVGPYLAMLGIFAVSAEATVGFLRQGEPLPALTTVIIFCGTAVGVPVYFYRTQRSRFQELAAELRTELSYPVARVTS